MDLDCVSVPTNEGLSALPRFNTQETPHTFESVSTLSIL